VPEAYLAPPQPGLPRYGTAPHPGGGRPFAGRPGYGEPGYGQQAGQVPGYGRPARARQGTGTASRRDIALASPWRRLGAQTIDWIIIIVVSVIVFWSQLAVVWREYRAITVRYYPDFSTPAAQAALNSFIRNSSYQHALTYWFAGMLGIAVAYFWVQHAAWGATLGKRIFGVRVVRAADRSRLGVVAAGLRTVAFLAGPAIFLLLALITPVSILGGVLWAADASLPLVDLRAQSLHDKLADTIVVRQAALEERPPRPSAW
jgi:uncharacterized RDD family membrane protein YckC